MSGMVKFKSPIIAKGFAEYHSSSMGRPILWHLIEQGERLSTKKGRDKLKEVRNIPVWYKEKYYNAENIKTDTLYRIDFEGHDILICDIGVHGGDSEELSLTPEHLFEMEE